MLSFTSPTWQSSLLSAAKSKSKSPHKFSSSSLSSSSSSSPIGRAASEIIPHLYLTDLFTARNESELIRLGITHILSVIEHEPAFPECVEGRGVKKLHIRVADRVEADLGGYLEETTRWIGGALESGGRVMVHCFQGVSRSATVVCAYLISTMFMTAPESIAFVQSKRGIVCPNLGFRVQLEAFEERCHGTAGEHDGKRLRCGKRVSRMGVGDGTGTGMGMGMGMVARIARFKEVAMGGGSRHLSANGVGSHSSGAGSGSGSSASASKQSLVVGDAVQVQVQVPRTDSAEEGGTKS